MLTVDKTDGTFLYEQVVHLIAGQVENGALRPGDRLPSLRGLSRRLDISVPTVRQAYLELERQGRIEARPKSGYFVQASRQNRLVRGARVSGKPSTVKRQALIDRVYDHIHQTGLLPLGIANPGMAHPATRTLHRAMKRVMARTESRLLGYAPAYGDPGLCRQIAYRYLNQGGSVDPAEVLITNGGQEALTLALQSVARSGDVIAVESPAYYGGLELIESLGMLALEIDTCPVNGVSLSALSKALEEHDIRACLFSAAVSNPLGCVSSDEGRRNLVQLLESRDVPLIEDDVYGDLVFSGERPRPAQFYAQRGQVLTVGSFSKTVAPGYRIGWLLPGRHLGRARKLKRAISCSSGLLQQLTLREFINSGDYDRHLNRLRPKLQHNAERMIACIEQYFPAETAISRPCGGSVLWLELPGGVDSEVLFDRAIDIGISITPGRIFSPADRYRNYMRLSFGHPWSEAIESGLEALGRLVRELAVSGRTPAPVPARHGQNLNPRVS
ncbi:PLP-dependent aminotransferase family protein [Elongatibacter sediminis]|uniref:PLP-dependent aminotransferase family protein n=1 Tax=Elongatibacter sediminis TaxID=3119006 RepID=A0AAW9RA51_9GAMM